MDAITANKAKQNLDHLIEQVTSNAEPTIICNDKDAKAVLMSLDEFDSWQETFYLLSNPVNAEHLRNSIEQAKTGKSKEQELIEP